jgi:glycogen(starch) synthase
MHAAKRILMTCDCVGGIWTYALDLACGLREYGFETELVAFGPAPTSQQRVQLARAQIQFEVAPFKLEWMNEPWSEVDQAISWLQRRVDQTRPDLLHFNGYSYAGASWQQPTLVVGHSCVLSWWQAVKGEAAPSSYREYRRRVNSGLSSATKVVAPSEAMLSSLQQHYDWSGNGIVIPNGRPAPESVEEKRPGIVSIGRFWDEAKGVRLLSEVAAQVSWPIYLVGDQERKPADNLTALRTLGKLSSAEVSDVLNRAMIYAAPVLYEPFGLAILEAGLRRCALVLSDLPALREIWQESAIFVDPRNHPEWRDKLNWLADDAVARNKLADRARARALEFSGELMCRRYAGLYGTMVRPRPLTHNEEPLR